MVTPYPLQYTLERGEGEEDEDEDEEVEDEEDEERGGEGGGYLLSQRGPATATICGQMIHLLPTHNSVGGPAR